MLNLADPEQLLLLILEAPDHESQLLLLRAGMTEASRITRNRAERAVKKALEEIGE